MSQQGLLSRVVSALDGLGLAYMLSGSTVSSLQGEPRMTHDIDLVIDLPAEAVGPMLQALDAPGVYLDPEAVSAAVRERAMFNLIDSTSGDKVDFWLLTEDDFDRSRFARRQSIHALGMHLFVSSPEDTILMKLKWGASAGGSEKQYRDALRVFEVQSGTLDMTYLREWAGKLGVSSALERIMAEAEVL